MDPGVYATLEDFHRYGLSAAAISQIDNTTILSALAASSDEASGYLLAQYALPLVSWGQDLRRMVCVLAAADLMAVRGYSPDAGADAYLETRANAARSWLAKVASGTVSLAQVVDSSPSMQNGGARVYTAELRGW